MDNAVLHHEVVHLTLVLDTPPHFSQVKLDPIVVIDVAKIVQLRPIRVLPLKRLVLFELNSLGDQNVDLSSMLSSLTFRL